MRFISIRQMRQNSAKVWRELKEDEEIILTSNGRPIAIMAGVDEKNVEKFLTVFRRAKAALALEEMQQASLKAGTATMSDRKIQSEIAATRKERKR